jgi:uncharacterized protein YbcI
VSACEEQQPSRGQLAAAISNSVVRITTEHTGRGPTQARTTINDDTILVLMRDTLTKGERSLELSGEDRFVLESRARHQRTMRDDLIKTVERLAGRKVLAFMSANHLKPDMAVEVFVMEPSTGDGLM